VALYHSLPAVNAGNASAAYRAGSAGQGPNLIGAMFLRSQPEGLTECCREAGGVRMAPLPATPL